MSGDSWSRMADRRSANAACREGHTDQESHKVPCHRNVADSTVNTTHMLWAYITTTVGLLKAHRRELNSTWTGALSECQKA